MPGIPPTIHTPPSAGSPPGAPPTIHTPPSSGTTPAAPAGVFSPPGAGSGDAFDLTDAVHPERAGRYVYLGLLDDENPLWAREDGNLALDELGVTGGGYYFIQRDGGGGTYVWNLEYSEDIFTTSPNLLLSASAFSVERTDEPTPLDVGSWYDWQEEGVAEDLTLLPAHTLAAPGAVYSPPSAGTPPSPPPVIYPPMVVGGIPENTLTLAGEPLTLAGEYLTL